MSRLPRRRRTLVTLVAVCCLLFQQLAVAAYACAMVGTPEPPAMADCHGDHGGGDAPADPLCEKHCSPDASTAAEARVGGVPALALPPPAFQLLAYSRLHATSTLDDAPGGSRGPPPTLAHARLLI